MYVCVSESDIFIVVKNKFDILMKVKTSFFKTIFKREFNQIISIKLLGVFSFYGQILENNKLEL